MEVIKKIPIFIFAFVVSETIFSQRLFLQVAGGTINYGGDLQQKNFTFSQANAAFGLGLSYNLSNHFSVAATYVSGKINASDLKSPKNATRNLSFYSNINEGSLTFEARLKELSYSGNFSPYLFGGVAVFHFNPYTFDTSNNKVYLQPLGTEGQGLPQYPDRKIYTLTQFAIPFGVGIKYALSERLILGAELGFRKLFTDYLDDVSTTYADTAILRAERGDLVAKLSFRGDELKPPLDFKAQKQRGNPNHNDTYYTCLLKLSFSLGNSSISGFSNNGFTRKMRKQNGCPPKVL